MFGHPFSFPAYAGLGLDLAVATFSLVRFAWMLGLELFRQLRGFRIKPLKVSHFSQGSRKQPTFFYLDPPVITADR